MTGRRRISSESVQHKLSRRHWLGQSASVTFATMMGLGQRRLLARSATPVHSCIVLWMNGGPSQIDTFDLKPGHANGGPFHEIETSVPGIRISEHLPKMAQRAHHLAIVRSMRTVEGDHLRATGHIHRGYKDRINVDYPCLGSLVAHELPSDATSLPAFVSVGSGENSAMCKPGFLGSKFSPMILRPNITNEDTANPTVTLEVKNMQPPAGLSRTGLAARSELLRTFNRDFAASRPDVVAVSHQVAFERALGLMSPKSRQAFNLDEEPAKLREAYGMDAFGQGCLLARRLVERNVGFVEVSIADVIGWDTHTNNFETVQRLSEQIDRGWSHLLDDLESRGLLKSTLVVWMGEFGRTPKINQRQGRDHFPAAWSTVLAGAHIQGGRVIGRTSRDGMQVEDRPVTVPDFLATVFQAMGLDHSKQNIAQDGQPIRLVDADAKPLREIL